MIKPVNSSVSFTEWYREERERAPVYNKPPSKRGGSDKGGKGGIERAPLKYTAERNLLSLSTPVTAAKHGSSGP